MASKKSTDNKKFLYIIGLGGVALLVIVLLWLTGQSSLLKTQVVPSPYSTQLGTDAMKSHVQCVREADSAYGKCVTGIPGNTPETVAKADAIKYCNAKYGDLRRTDPGYDRWLECYNDFWPARKAFILNQCYLEYGGAINACYAKHLKPVE